MEKRKTLSFYSADNPYFSTIKTIGKLREPGDEVEYPANFDSISL